MQSNLSDLHAALAAAAFESVLGRAERGTMAFARCLPPDVVTGLARNPAFAPNNWQVQRVADGEDRENRTISADQAVELRENKGPAILLLIDTDLAGAGMDGIYSAAQEVGENSFFQAACKLAGEAITQNHSAGLRQDAELAIRRAQGHGGRRSISPWIQFDYLVRVAAGIGHPGELLYLLGMWPAHPEPGISMQDTLATSRLFIERLLSSESAGLTPAQRINALNLLQPSQDQLNRLEHFVRAAATQPLQQAMESLAQQPDLWVNLLRMESSADEVQRIELRLWRTKSGKVASWSGLKEDPSDETNPPLFIMDPRADSARNHSKLSIQWTASPETVKKGSVQYQVRLLTDMDEEITSREVTHSTRNFETCYFTNDDFSLLDEDDLVNAKVVVSVVGNSDVEEVESEEIRIKFGEPPDQESSSAATKVRTLVEGAIELDSWDVVSSLITAEKRLPEDNKGFITLRTPNPKKSYKVFRPSLIRQAEEQWAAQGGAIGRWQVRVRISGERAGEPIFLSLKDYAPLSQGSLDPSWQRTEAVSRRMAELFMAASGVAQIYDERSAPFRNVVKEYLLAWADLLEKGPSVLALANTVEVQSLSGRTLGLIVLPNHPLRIAWHAAYDNLVLHTAFQQKAAPKAIRKEFSLLDGAMFPAFLPGLLPGSTFVFADTLGFHAVGMVLDQDKEPKATMAMLAKALGENDTADSAPVVAHQSAIVLGKEIQKYLDCHRTSQVLHIHALRPGDALTVARALGEVQKIFAQRQKTEGDEEGGDAQKPSFVLDLYPADRRKAMAGRFIAEAREKRRRGAGVVAEQDRWMLDSLSLPGGINRPLLRWARKDDSLPETPAHLAVAFDTFESRVVTGDESSECPLYAYGLLSFFERSFQGLPAPFWQSVAPTPTKGEKHPTDRVHTDRLLRIQKAVETAVIRHMGEQAKMPTLLTEITPEKADSLQKLHRLCDWVITLDRNAGVEYFDSPRENRAIYDAYVIDAVPERDDLGCLQLITSTSNLDEVQNLLDDALDQMGLSHSRRNAEFLMENLKALSGRLAIRLTGQNVPSAELIGLAMCHANCRRAESADPAWVSLQNGFLIPVDDVLDLISPLNNAKPDAEQIGGSRVRPDLIYVSLLPRRGLAFQLIEVKYRRHLRATRMPDLLDTIDKQVRNLRKQWDEWFSQEQVISSFRSLRRAKLARVLRFYADKAHRHHLPEHKYREIIEEIDRMVERGGEYPFAQLERGDRGWIFCPEYTADNPLEITPIGWETQIFLFGPALMDDLRSPLSELQTPTVESRSPNGHSPSSAMGMSITSTWENGDDRLAEDAEQIEDVAPEAPSNENQLTAPEPEPSIILGEEVFGGMNVGWKLTTKGNPHLLIAGLPGMGKTTCLLNLCKQMVKNRVLPIIFSYHQDIDERLEAEIGDVRFLDYRGLGFNPLQVLERGGFMPHLDVAGAMRDIFTAIYPELGDIQGDRIRTAIKDSFQELGWGDPSADLSALQEPPFRRFLEILRADPKPDRGLKTLLARLTELDDYGFFAPSQSSQSLWTEARPTVIRIHTTQNETLQQAFASLIFYGLYKDMFRRGPQNWITHSLIFDEAHRAARLTLLPTMAKECRKYGVSLVVASQEAKDFNPSLFSAIANYLVLRLTDVDAKSLARNVASSDQERIFIDKIKQMERFRALYFSEGKKKPSMIRLLP